MNEFVRLSDDERNYGAKALLQSQVASISSIKRFGDYEKLRNEELMLKVELKMKVEQALQSLTNLARSLPKTDYGETETEMENPFALFTEKEEKRERTVEDELDEIRRKLEAIK